MSYSVPRESRALVIGAGGKFLKKLLARESVFRVELKEGSLRILCTRSAWEEFDPVVRKKIALGIETDYAEKAPYHENISVPADRVSFIIGKGGSFIASLKSLPGILFVNLAKTPPLGHHVLTIGAVSRLTLDAAIALALEKTRPPQRNDGWDNGWMDDDDDAFGWI